MSEVTLHRTPRWRDVVREQVRIVCLSLRREALVVALVLGIVTLVIGVDIARGNAATWFDSDDWAGLGAISFLVPFAVWWREKRFGPAFLWTLPVDRRQLALAKVFGGWVCLIAALAFFVTWQAALAAAYGVAGARTVTPDVFSGATALYLFGSALVLGLRHPLRWLLGTAGLLFLLGFLEGTLGRGVFGIDALLHSTGFTSTARAAMVRWRALPELAQWAVSNFLAIGFGLVALWAAVSRHAEQRRR